MTSQRWIAPLVALVLLLLAPGRAWADSVSVQQNNITFDRAVPRKDNQTPDAISRLDCVDDVTIHFPVTVRATSRTLEVWVGNGDCTNQQQRIDNVCVLVWSDFVDSTTTEIDISTQDFLKGQLTGSCDTATSADAVELTALFAFQQNSMPSDVAGESATIQVTYDLTGPPPPTITKLNAGDGKVFVGWDDSGAGSPVGYRLYCSSGSQGASTSTGAAGAPATNCGSALVAGEVPDEANNCGKVTGQSVTSGTVKDVTNGQSYAVGVAAVDSVGNVGELAVGLDCVTPQEVTDFYEAYVAAGGKGGGGYCTFGLHRPGSLAGLLLFGLVGYFARRRFRP